MALYGLKSSCPAFRLKLLGVLHGIYYDPTKANPYVWIRPAINLNRNKYYGMLLWYVDDVLVLLHAPMRTIEGIKAILKLKDDKAEEPEMYIVASLQKVLMVGGTACWTMYSDKYVRAAVMNLEERFNKTDHRLTSICETPMSKEYHPSEDFLGN